MSRVIVSKRLLMINSASSAISVLASLSILIWLQQYLLKRISAEEFSLLPIVMAMMSFVPLVSVVLNGGIGRFVTIAYMREDDEEVACITSTMFPLLLGAGFVLMGIAGLLAWKIDWVLKIEPSRISDARLMLLMLFFAAAVQLPASAFLSGFSVRQKLVQRDLIDFGCQMFRFAILFALLFGVSTRVIWVVAATVAGELARVIISTIYSIRLVPSQRFRRDAIRWSRARELVSYGGWSFVEQLANAARDAMDPIILNRFATAVDVATYHVGGIPARQISMLGHPLAKPFIPVVAALHAVGDTDKLRSVYLRGGRYHGWFKLGVGIPAMVFADEVMFLYLDGLYPRAGTVMTMLLLAEIITGLNTIGAFAALAMGKVKQYASRMLLVHAFNLAMTLVLVGGLHWGVTGSAVATLAALFVVNIPVTWTYTARLCSTTFKQWYSQIFVPTLIPGLAPLLLCILAKHWFALDSWLSVFSVSTLSAVVYFGIIFAFFLPESDKNDLAKVKGRLPGPVRRLFGVSGE